MPLSRINNNAIANNTIVAADLAAGSVTGDKIGATAINANNIVNGTITTTQIASNTISNTNIATGAIENYSRATGLLSGMRNRIINGAMVIDQRNAGASVTPASFSYTLDRWQAVQTTASKFSVQQNAGSVTPPAGFSNYLGVTSLSAYSVGAGDTFNILQSIEGFNCADLAWGTASAKAVTVSFWVRSSLTGTFGGAIKDGSSTNAYPFTYTISAANTWEYKTVNITAPTSGQFSYTSTTNGIGLQVVFGLGAGANFSGTAGAWAAFNAYTATGATSVVGTNGATFYITGVQLEVGSTATSFDYRPYGTELALCQRYFEKLDTTATGWNVSTTIAELGVNFSTKRGTPTITGTGGFIRYGPGGQLTPTMTYANISTTTGYVYATCSGGLTQNYPSVVQFTSSVSAEL